MTFRQYFVYIMTNRSHTVLYTGVTKNLVERVTSHREQECPGLPSGYTATKLVYFESFSDIDKAIEREKTIKTGPRKKKLELIDGTNPDWNDLLASLFVA